MPPTARICARTKRHLTPSLSTAAPLSRPTDQHLAVRLQPAGARLPTGRREAAGGRTAVGGRAAAQVSGAGRGEGGSWTAGDDLEAVPAALPSTRRSLLLTSPRHSTLQNLTLQPPPNGTHTHTHTHTRTHSTCHPTVRTHTPALPTLSYA